jgi:hypothetical protein
MTRHPLTGRFAKRIEPARLLLWQPKSAAHVAGHRTRKARRSEAVRAHVEALRLDVALRRGWL